jgi:hypothetical protein
VSLPSENSSPLEDLSTLGEETQAVKPITTWCAISAEACWLGESSCWGLPLGGAVGDQAGDGQVGLVEFFASSEVALENAPLLVLCVSVLDADAF